MIYCCFSHPGRRPSSVREHTEWLPPTEAGPQDDSASDGPSCHPLLDPHNFLPQPPALGPGVPPDGWALRGSSQRQRVRCGHVLHQVQVNNEDDRGELLS